MIVVQCLCVVQVVACFIENEKTHLTLEPRYVGLLQNHSPCFPIILYIHRSLLKMNDIINQESYALQT